MIQPKQCLLFLALCVPLAAWSQEKENADAAPRVIIHDLEVRKVAVSPTSATVSGEKVPALQLEIPEASAEAVSKSFERAIRNKTKSKFVEEGEWKSLGETNISAISDEPVGVVFQVRPGETSATLTVGFRDQGQYVEASATPETHQKVKNYLYDFGVERYRETVDEQLKAERKKLSDMENELNKLRKANERMHMDIKENEANIKNAEIDIEATEEEQKRKDEEIRQQNDRVKATTDAEARKTANKDLKALEKEKDKLRNKMVDLNRRIVKYNTAITDNEASIKVNVDDQAIQLQKVEEQRAYVRGLQAKRDKIK